MRNSETSEYGPRLVALIHQARGPLSVREFARQHGLDHARISLWGNGTRPSYEHLRPVADACGVTLGELFVIMGVGTLDDFAIRTPPPSLEDAINRGDDPWLNDEGRAMFRDLVRVLKRVHEGEQAVTVSNVTSGRSTAKRERGGK